MKRSISRQNIYLLILSIFLLIFVLLFSFLVLIPEGKAYREQRLALKKETRELRRYQEYHNDIYARFKQLQSDNRHIVSAFRTPFSAERFHKKHKVFFESLSLSKIINSPDEGNFCVYEVNTTSKIDSPKSFYNFLDALNKSDWIIGVNFPIHFKRDAELIRSSFTMKVYEAKEEKDRNSTTIKSDAEVL